jgi:hypothetical protein
VKVYTHERCRVRDSTLSASQQAERRGSLPFDAPHGHTNVLARFRKVRRQVMAHSQHSAVARYSPRVLRILPGSKITVRVSLDLTSVVPYVANRQGIDESQRIRVLQVDGSFSIPHIKHLRDARADWGTFSNVHAGGFPNPLRCLHALFDRRERGRRNDRRPLSVFMAKNDRRRAIGFGDDSGVVWGD